MGSIPHGVFVTHQVRSEVNKYEAAQTHTANTSVKDVFEDIAMEQPPLKYNSKLMNSIWGLYNRYSVHNIKQNTDVVAGNLNLQQSLQISDDNAAQLGPTDVTITSAPSTSLGGGNTSKPIGGTMNTYRSFAMKGLRAL